MNDYCALILFEAAFGSVKGYKHVAWKFLQTGTGGGVASKGQLVNNGACVGGKFGYIFARGYLIQKYDLLIVSCRCVKVGCIETLISSPKMTWLAGAMTELTIMLRDIDKSLR